MTSCLGAFNDWELRSSKLSLDYVRQSSDNNGDPASLHGNYKIANVPRVSPTSILIHAVHVETI